MMEEASVERRANWIRDSVCSSTLALLMLILISNEIFSETNETFVSEYAEELVGGAHGSLLASILINWPVVSIIFILIMLVLISVAYMFSKAFNLPSVKAWADTEITQLIVSAIIVVILVSALLFLGMLSELIVTGAFSDFSFDSGPNALPKHVQIADFYMKEALKSVESAAKDLLKENIELGKIATKREGISIQTLPFIASSSNKNAYKRLDMTRNNVIFQHYGRIISSLKAQEVFMNGIGLYIGPFFLLAGVVLRAFFMTRRAGGLFIAIGIGLLFVYPLAYSLTLYTLKMTVYGYRLAPDEQTCPPECLLRYPFGYNSSNTSQTFDLVDMTRFLPPGSSYFDYVGDDEFWQNISDTYGVVNCDWACKGCALACRELPPINGLCDCNETACAECPRQCKILRVRTDCVDITSENYCDEMICPNYCRLNYTNTVSYTHLTLPTKD